MITFYTLNNYTPIYISVKYKWKNYPNLLDMWTVPQ